MVMVAFVAALLGAAVGGTVGGLTGAAAGRHAASKAAAQSLLIPTATLPAASAALPRQKAGPGSVTAIAAAVVPSVVTVQVRSDTERGTGAGVIIRSDGYILTNNHVVAPSGSGVGVLTVDLSASQTGLPARVVGRSPVDDLAVIKIDLTGLRSARLGSSGGLQVGDLVVAVGAPLGLSGSVTSGIVSALSRNVDVPDAQDPTKATVLGDAIQTDAAINPGNSGGALVDSTGSVVGINSAIASTGTDPNAQSGSIGVGFAIPIDYARSVAEEIIRTGRATHPYLGVYPDTVNKDNALPGAPTSGAYVSKVNAGTPAATAGLTVGDVIVAVDGKPVTSADDLIVLTRQHKVGETVTLTVVRAGTARAVQVMLGQNPNE
ncbi:MAG TPA: trypsin-like peptidase domain-containing protein [Mycobacteriales bacterium]|nr:trypsin-like peptidase domain-containing protein [Mycobacteriales bacterium]